LCEFETLDFEQFTVLEHFSAAKPERGVVDILGDVAGIAGWMFGRARVSKFRPRNMGPVGEDFGESRARRRFVVKTGGNEPRVAGETRRGPHFSSSVAFQIRWHRETWGAGFSRDSGAVRMRNFIRLDFPFVRWGGFWDMICRILY